MQRVRMRMDGPDLKTSEVSAPTRGWGCPGCGAERVEVFYEARDVPVHACVLLEDREAALDCPRGDLVLGFCHTCGFITNVLFDEREAPQGGPYEDQQSFSPRFRTFQTDLVRRLVEQYGVRGRDVVEIGCGKGDFLIELCSAGDNRGVGIDPLSPPEPPSGAGRRVRFIADHYGPQHAGIPCDVVCCRHTLEHLPHVGEFVRALRRTIGDRRDTLVFFEVPDVQRVLRERAFWDIYYEHCSYFSRGSLARLFSACGFEILEVSTDFEDQYLLLTARPKAAVDDEVEGGASSSGSGREHTMSSGRPLSQIEDVADLAEDVARFATDTRTKIERWRQRLQGARRRGHGVAIWGSGSKCLGFLSALGLGGEIDWIVDINPRRHGRFLPGLGLPIASPEALREAPPDLILVMNPVYEQEIRRQVADMGMTVEVESV